jgi:2-keto-4-pentenoate hydratase/2-oxohepta-3-ene-1,7-dioic acid hydratase in catechol pathway
MKLALFQPTGGDIQPGLLVTDRIIPFGEAVAHLVSHSPQNLMEQIIDNFEELRPRLDQLAASGTGIALSAGRLHPPLPRPGKILACIGNYWEHAQREARPLNMFLKNPDAVIGPGDTVVLPRSEEPYVFHHEAELAMVFKGPAKMVSQANYRDAIFGYTCIIDVSGRGEGRRTWRSGSWMGKSFDTFAPIGPCILTADEVPDPNDLEVKFWNNGVLMHQYNTNDMEHRVPELIEFATTIMTMNSGDLLACGTNHEGLGPLQEGDTAEIEIQGIGKMAVNVTDPLKRSWERGIFMGEGSTNPAAQANS